MTFKTLGVVTIGQAPRDDLVPALVPLLPPCRIVQRGALDGLTRADIDALAPAPGEHPLVSRLADGDSVVFGHDRSLPLVERAVARAEDDGADAVLIVCSGSFPPLPHRRPLLLTEPLAHHAVAGLAAGARVGIVRPLADQVEDGARAWGRTLGTPVAAVTAVSPYTATLAEIAATAAQIADRCDLIVLDCIGFDDAMRTAAARATDRPVLLVRTLAARLTAELLAGL
ncbi:AroM family protein [Pseudonocardia acaciae]|uniref:AroM family protein n=1 Tax=Pseudonocardia acaciae TaxID=551276 RepID=UPI00048B41F1|nr:AroM family protein [Pseudonocardia acaciae]